MYNRDRARFDAADIDKDGKLTEGEFLLFKNPLKDENVKAVVIDEALKAVDTDGDGKISLEEYLNDWHVKVRQLNNANCFLKKVPILSTNFARVIAKKNLKLQPTNVDEDFDELETDRFNDEYDRNSDGYLTGDELLFWVSFKLWNSNDKNSPSKTPKILAFSRQYRNRYR